MTKEHNLLIEKAGTLTNTTKLTELCVAGEVGCALITDKDNIYTGVSIDCGCSIGFCAEHSAVASMITGGESKIKAIVAVNCDKKVVPPCGRCRELLYQINKNNLNTRVIIGKGKTVLLKELLNYRWQDI